MIYFVYYYLMYVFVYNKYTKAVIQLHKSFKLYAKVNINE